MFYRLKHQILPTLIAMCADNATNIRVLHSELSPTLLTDYLSRIMEKDKKGQTTVSTVVNSAAVILGTGNPSDTFDPVQEMKDRIPPSLWPVLIEQLQMPR